MLCKTSVCSSLRMTISVFILIFSWLSLLTVSSSYRVLCPYSAIIYPIYSIFYFSLKVCNELCQARRRIFRMRPLLSSLQERHRRFRRALCRLSGHGVSFSKHQLVQVPRLLTACSSRSRNTPSALLRQSGRGQFGDLSTWQNI